MQKFTKIFAVLSQAEMNEELEKALRLVSQMLNLEFDKIRVFFDQSKQVRRPELTRENFTPPSKLAHLEKAIEAVKAKSKGIKVKKSSLSYLNRITLYASKLYFQESIKQDSIDKKIKNWDRLISELILDVQSSSNDTTAEEIEMQTKTIRESLPQIQKYYTEWSKRGVADISMYSNACKAEEKIFTPEQMYEAIAVLDRANELATGGYRLRAPQILSVLVFLTSMGSYHGKLCQIESGEGT